MENKHFDVTPEIKKRIRTEMKKNELTKTNESLAYFLDLSSTQVSRILNGQSSCSSEYLDKLAKLWEVRKDYLLCNDDYRTDDDIYAIKGKKLSEKNKAVRQLLELSGYKFEMVELLSITSGDIVRLKDMDGELNFIKEYLEENSKTNIELIFRQLAKRKANASTHHIFQLRGGLLKKYLFNRGADPQKYRTIQTDAGWFKILPDENGVCHEIIGFISFWTRITRNNELIGYVKYLDNYLGILSENTNTLFASMLKADKNMITEWKMILNP